MSQQEQETLAKALHAPLYPQPELVLRVDVCLAWRQASGKVAKGSEWCPYGSEKSLETSLCSGATTLLSVTNKTTDHGPLLPSPTKMETCNEVKEEQGQGAKWDFSARPA